MEKKNVFEEIVSFDKKEFEDAIDKAYENKKSEIKLDGFRKGKVPKDIYFKKVGKESLYFDAMEILLPKAYDIALKDYKPIIDPKVDIKSVDENGVSFVFTITTMPEVKIKKYKGLNIEKEKVEVSKEEIEHEIGHLLERFTEFEVKEGSVENGDIAVIDFEGFKDGVAFEGGKATNYSLEIGSGSFIPGFEEQLVGMNAGEEKDINVTFPEEYHQEDLKGADAVFKVKVHEVKSKALRELDEEFFEDLGLEGVNSKETLEEEVEKNIKAAKEKNVEEKFIEDVLAEIGKNTEVEIPEELVEDEINHMVHNFEEQIRMQGLSLEVFYEMTKSSEADLRAQMKDEANKHVLYRIILDKVCELEKIEVTDEEVDTELDTLAKRYAVSKEEFLGMYGDANMLKYELEVKKVFDLLTKENEKKQK